MHHGLTDSGIFAVREMVLQEDVDKMLCCLRPPVRCLFSDAALRRLGQPEELPTGNTQLKRIGFPQCRRSEDKENFVVFFRK